MKKTLLNLFCLILVAINVGAQNSEQEVKSIFISSLEKEQFLNASQINCKISSQYTSAQQGIQHIYGNQVVNGLENFQFYIRYSFK